MKKVVLTIKDDVCAANGKDVNATELLEKMKLWGEVTDFNKETAAICAEYQASIDSLARQLNAVKAQELTPDELVLLAAYRECKIDVTKVFKERVNDLEVTLAEIKDEEEKRIENIIAMLRGNN